MSSGKVLPTNMEISPTNRGACIEQRSCKVRLGEVVASSCTAGSLLRAGRLVRYGVGNERCSSNNPDAPSASRELARHSWRPGSNFGSRFGQPSLLAFALSGPCGTRVWAIALSLCHSGHREEKVPCSSGTYVGVLGGFIGSKIQRNQYRETDRKQPKKIQLGRRLKPRRRKKSFQ